MADYYPLLAKAAAGPSGATLEARQAMYDRARKALLAQLRSIDPPAATEDIDRENAALDAAIARVEADLQTKATDVGGSDTGRDAASGTPSPAPGKSTLRTPPTPPRIERGDKQPRDGASDVVEAPAPDPHSKHAPAKDALGKDTPGKDTLGKSIFAAGALATGALAVAPDAQAAAAGGDAKSEPVATAASRSEPELRLRTREAQRPLAPVPPEPRGQSRRLWIFGGVVAVVVALVAAAALKLRDSPDELARLKPISAPTVESAANGKIAERVGRDDTALVSAPVRGAAATGTTAPPTVTQAPIPVATRGALLVEAPDLDAKVRTFAGSGVWRLDNVPAGPGQPLGTAVHGDVDVPEARVKLSIDIRKNSDPAFSASNTIELRFTMGANSALPGISQIGMPQMRRDDSPNGDFLTGVPVKITETYFLVGLSQGDSEKRNTDLMRSRGWIDIPIQLTDNRVAKITVEKGAAGDRILADALSTWAQ